MHPITATPHTAAFLAARWGITPRRIPAWCDLANDRTFTVAVALMFAGGVLWAVVAPGMWPLMPLWVLIALAVWRRGLHP